MGETLVRDSTIFEAIVSGEDPSELTKHELETLASFVKDSDSSARREAAQYLRKNGYLEYELTDDWERLVDEQLAERHFHI